MQKVVVFVTDALVLERVSTTLGRMPNLEVAISSSEREALGAINEDTVVLTDLRMARPLEFLRDARDAACETATPVVVVSSPDNEQLAMQALREVAASYCPSQLIEKELQRTLENVFAMSDAQHEQLRIMNCVTRWNGDFELDNDASLIRPLVRYLLESTQRLGVLCEPGEETRLGIALEEALLNSMYHGNLEVSSAVRETDEDRFYELIAARRKVKPYVDRSVRLRANFSRDSVSFVIEDDGPGFDVSSIPDPTDPNNVERVSGRGVLLMRTFMDVVEYNEKGNQVTLVKRRQACDTR